MPWFGMSRLTKQHTDHTCEHIWMAGAPINLPSLCAALSVAKQSVFIKLRWMLTSDISYLGTSTPISIKPPFIGSDFHLFRRNYSRHSDRSFNVGGDQRRRLVESPCAWSPFGRRLVESPCAWSPFGRRLAESPYALLALAIDVVPRRGLK